jgi:hypothetical protein
MEYSMNDALIGYTGFVGSTLRKQTSFDSLYRSTNINEIRDQQFDTVVCAGAPAQKWLANRDPEKDKQQIATLIEPLKTIRCNRFILISTVDVFNDPIGVDETTEINPERLQAYGLHRYELERFVQAQFDCHLIVRLPGLVGPGLRKNIIYDFLNNNRLEAIDSRGVFQFYPMVNLWYDIQVALAAGLKLVHLSSEPLAVAEVAKSGFGLSFDNLSVEVPPKYDMRSHHAEQFGGSGRYQYSCRETLQAIRAYAQSEPLANKE